MSPEVAVEVEITTAVDRGGAEVIHRLAERWERLCEETRSAPFHRPEWVAAYLRAFEPGSEVVVLTASAGERLVAVLPMVRKRCWYAGVPLTKLAAAANVHSVRFEILRSACAAGEASIPALWHTLQRTSGWQVLEFPFFPQGGACAKFLEQAREDGYLVRTLLIHDSPTLRLQKESGGQLTWLAGTSRHFRHELRRYARVLEEEGGAKPKFTRWDHPEPTAFQRFYELEAAGWKGRRGSAINCEPETLAFYDEIARQGAERGYFCLHTLEVNGKLAAGAFSVTSPGCFFPMKIAFNEGLRRGAPGHLLFNSILEECAGNGVPELFFGGAHDHYKDLWTQETLPHLTGFVFAPGLLSLLACQLRTRVLPVLLKLRRDLLDGWERYRKRRMERKTQAGKKVDGTGLSHSRP